MRADAGVQPIHVRGRLVDTNNRPVTGVRVTLRDACAGTDTRPVSSGTTVIAIETTGAPGSFDLAVASLAFPWELDCYKSGFERMRSVVDIALGPSIDLGDLVIRPGRRIVGIVADAVTNAPVPNCEVWATPWSCNEADRDVSEIVGVRVRTDADGRFALKDLEWRRVWLVARCQEYRTRVVEILAAAGRPDVRLSLERGRLRKGRVVGGDGQPIAGVTIRTLAHVNKTWITISKGRSSASGEIPIEELSDYHTYDATDGRWSVTRETRLPSGEVELGMERTPLVTFVDSRARTPITNIHCVAGPFRCDLPFALVVKRARPEATNSREDFALMDHDSEYINESPGSCGLTMYRTPEWKERLAFTIHRNDGTYLASESLEVSRLTDGEAVEVAATPCRSDRLRGRVRAFSGSRIATVVAIAYGTHWWDHAFIERRVRSTDEAGYFDFGPTPPGEYSIFAFSGDRRSDTLTLNTWDTPPPDSIDLELAPMCGIHGRILDRSGAPASGELLFAVAPTRGVSDHQSVLDVAISTANGRYNFCVPVGSVVSIARSQRYFIEGEGLSSLSAWWLTRSIESTIGEALTPSSIRIAADTSIADLTVPQRRVRRLLGGRIKGNQTPFQGAWVELRESTEKYFHCHAVPDSTGVFEFDGLVGDETLFEARESIDCGPPVLVKSFPIDFSSARFLDVEVPDDRPKREPQESDDCEEDR